MQLNLVDLERTSVGHVMVPRNEVVGIDLGGDIDAITATILNSRHTRLPVYKDDLNNVVGILHLRNAARWMAMEHRNKAELLQLTQDAYFIPDSTNLPTQLVNFQKHHKRMAMVVDEYGVVNGLLTLEDLLDEIVGHVSTTSAEGKPDIFPQTDGTFVLDGSIAIRDVNRALGWQLPTDGPKTVNGLLTELLENIPDSQVGLRLAGYHAEILQTKDNLIKSVRMWRISDLTDEGETDEQYSNEAQANTQD